MSIKELVEGTSVEGLTGLVEKLEVALTKAQKQYLRLTIRDESGSIAGVMWEYTPAPWLKEGAVVSVNALVSSYNGQPQLNYQTISVSDVDPNKFVKSSKFSVDKMWDDLAALVGSFSEPLTRHVAEEILLKHAGVIDLLKRAPAAKGVHNAWHGGLVEHIWSLCHIAKGVIEHYQTRYCQHISRDKVLFGLMLHDAGKIVEYEFSGPLISYTLLGQLTPHIVLGPSWVFEAANKWWKEHAAQQAGETKAPPVPGLSFDKFKIERAHLMHILASHHGVLEWGSPVKPASIEAILVHHLDNLDSKVMHALDFVLGGEGPIKGLSERSWIEKVSFLQYPKE